ncbi:MAG TPA: 30S ribosomal protein S3 [Proteobacteria bacterium]|nr:30S ribosomal protein S3 [Pseudomonadota bacterium]
MGQKTHPKGYRLVVTRDWDSKWYADPKDYVKFLHEDVYIRDFVKRWAQDLTAVRGRQDPFAAGISRITVERTPNRVKVKIHTSKPGLIIGKKGVELERLRRELQKVVSPRDLHIDVEEVRKPELDATLVAENIAQQIMRRVSHRRAMKRAMMASMKQGALGIKIMVAGRLGGAELARREWYREGRVPLNTLRANVDYGFAEAKTKYGVIGVKVWLYKGDSKSS